MTICYTSQGDLANCSCIPAQETACEDHYLAQETGSSGQPASIMVSVRGEPRSMTVFEVGRLEVTEFAALWTVGPSTQPPWLMSCVFLRRRTCTDC